MQDLWGNEIGDDYIIVTIKSEEWLIEACTVSVTMVKAIIFLNLVPTGKSFVQLNVGLNLYSKDL